MASGKCIELHETWCKAKKLEWIVCIVCTARYAVNWKHKCYHKYCVKCSTHYKDTEDHRCFICKDKHRLEADGSGYKVSKVYKALVYKKHSDLFKTYIRKFLKIKLEASGIPAHIDWETFSKEHEQRLVITFDRDKMIRNEGMRAMAKLLLNSLWGKLGQDPRLSRQW